MEGSGSLDRQLNELNNATLVPDVYKNTSPEGARDNDNDMLLLKCSNDNHVHHPDNITVGFRDSGQHMRTHLSGMSTVRLAEKSGSDQSAVLCDDNSNDSKASFESSWQEIRHLEHTKNNLVVYDESRIEPADKAAPVSASDLTSLANPFSINTLWWWDTEGLTFGTYKTFGKPAQSEVPRWEKGAENIFQRRADSPEETSHAKDHGNPQPIDSVETRDQNIETGYAFFQGGEAEPSAIFDDSYQRCFTEDTVGDVVESQDPREAQLNDSDSGVASTELSELAPLASTPVVLSSFIPREAPPSPLAGCSPSLDTTPLIPKRHQMTYRELKPINFWDLYARDRLCGEADDFDIHERDLEDAWTSRNLSGSSKDEFSSIQVERSVEDSGIELKQANRSVSAYRDHYSDPPKLSIAKSYCEENPNENFYVRKVYAPEGVYRDSEGKAPAPGPVDSAFDNDVHDITSDLVTSKNQRNLGNQPMGGETGDVSDNHTSLIGPCSAGFYTHSCSGRLGSELGATSPKHITISDGDKHDTGQVYESRLLCYERVTEELEPETCHSCPDRKSIATLGPRRRTKRNTIHGLIDEKAKQSSREAGEIDNNVNDEKVEDNDDDDEVFSESSCWAESVCGGSPTNFAVLFRHCRGERDAGEVQFEDRPSRSSLRLGGSDGDRRVLCAERVSQMTKTYNDIEAVTRLLEEKERDLELAARIGQTLLSKNKELAARTETLEEQLSQATERANQLRHEMGMKDELLRFYNEDLEHDSGGDSPPAEKPALDVVNVDFLEKKVKSLEDENLHLRLESANLQTATSNYEDKEKKLVEDCIQQLAEVNQQVETFASELQLKSEENLHQKEEIKTFLGQIAGLQTKIRKLTLENMDMHEKLTASTESQYKLTKELGTMQDRYDELMEMLEESQDELQLMRSRQRLKSSAGSQHQAAAYTIPTDSLASELENSLRQEQLDQALGQRRAQSWRVFETAKAAKKAAAKAALSSSSTSRMSISASGDVTGPSSICDSSRLSVCTSDVESQASDGYSGDLDSLYESNSELGRPGIPGSNDLDNALRRLATRRANEMNEREFLAREREAQKARKFSGSSDCSMLSSQMFDAPGRVGGGSGGGAEGGEPISGPHSPTGSISSVWSSATGLAQPTGPSGQGYKISDRLQIVKPMEGSMTLRHWKHLANPHLGGIFEQREGIQLKGERSQGNSTGETYSISDPEEDDEPHDIHTRKEQDQGLIYTFTDSTVQSFGPYRGPGTQFGSSTTSSMANLSTPSIGTERLPFGTSTPKNSSGARVSTNSTPGSSKTDDSFGKMANSSSGSYTMSSGLASLLESKESPIVGRSLLRAASIPRLNLSSTGSSKALAASSESNGFFSLSARSVSAVSEASLSKPPMSTTATSTVSALDLNPSWASWASRSTGNLSAFPPPSSTSSSLSSLKWKQKVPGSGSFDDSSSYPLLKNSFRTEGENVKVTLSNPSSPRRGAIFTPGMTGQGLLQQLKSKGLSLYGLWSGKPENQTEEKAARATRLPSGSSIDAGHEENVSGTKVAVVEGDEHEAMEPSFESIMPSDSGVLGALTNFRRSGIL